MKKIVITIVGLVSAALFASPYSPETWFHIIDGNASKEGIAADIEAIAEAFSSSTEAGAETSGRA